jgi:sugar phosphate permease
VATVVSLLYGLSATKILWLPLALSGVLLVTFVVTEVYIAPEPIVPIVVLKSRSALFACVAQLGVMSARWAVLFYTPVYAIAIRGWSPASAGSILLPTNMGFAAGGLLVGWLHIKGVGSYWLYVPSISSELLSICL